MGHEFCQVTEMDQTCFQGSIASLGRQVSLQLKAVSTAVQMCRGWGKQGWPVGPASRVGSKEVLPESSRMSRS